MGRRAGRRGRVFGRRRTERTALALTYCGSELPAGPRRCATPPAKAAPSNGSWRIRTPRCAGRGTGETHRTNKDNGTCSVTSRTCRPRRDGVVRPVLVQPRRGREGDGVLHPEEHAEFLRRAPQFEDMLVSDGISLTKFWFSVSPAEQRTRFAIRQVDPVRQWKLSPTDIESLDKWEAYTEAKEEMFKATPTPTTRRGSSSRATTSNAPDSTPCATYSISSTTTIRITSWSVSPIP